MPTLVYGCNWPVWSVASAAVCRHLHATLTVARVCVPARRRPARALLDPTRDCPPGPWRRRGRRDSHRPSLHARRAAPLARWRGHRASGSGDWLGGQGARRVRAHGARQAPVAFARCQPNRGKRLWHEDQTEFSGECGAFYKQGFPLSRKSPCQGLDEHAECIGRYIGNFSCCLLCRGHP